MAVQYRTFFEKKSCVTPNPDESFGTQAERAAAQLEKEKNEKLAEELVRNLPVLA